MPGFLGYFSSDSSDLDTGSVLETINLLGHCETQAFDLDSGFCAVSWLRNSSIPARRYLEDARYTCCFAGDLTGCSEIPWNDIIEIIKNRDFRRFSDFRGAFAISVYDRTNSTISVISDRISQQPVYYHENDSRLVFSTSLALFSRIPGVYKINEKWIWELMFFNYPVGNTTFVENVYKMPAASILEFDLNTSKLTLLPYADPFRRTGNPLTGNHALTVAASVFESRISSQFDGAERAAVSITGGFDSRTILSQAPLDRVDTYTYGIEGSGDLREGREIASKAGLNHQSIEFGQPFLGELPDLIEQTIFLSGGMERIVRATLPYVYRKLTANGTRYPIIVTGVSGDHLFRDHINGTGNVPSIISPDMMNVFHTGKVSQNNDFSRSMFGGRYPEYVDYIYTVSKQLAERHGTLNTPEAYLSYLIYEVTPRYFAGEAEIARNFGTFRSPYWDTDIIQLAFDIEYSTLGFSKTLPFKDKYRECVLQSSIIQKNRRLRHSHINGLPLSIYTADNKLYYHMARLMLRGPGKITSLLNRPRYTPPENWNRWFEELLGKSIDRLLGKESHIAEYLGQSFIENMISSGDSYWLGKILTAETVLRLFYRGWRCDKPFIGNISEAE